MTVETQTRKAMELPVNFSVVVANLANSLSIVSLPGAGISGFGRWLNAFVSSCGLGSQVSSDVERIVLRLDLLSSKLG
jgi:hypothetical protein